VAQPSKNNLKEWMNMKATRNFFWAAGIGFLCFASSAIASDTLTLPAIGSLPNFFYGEYTSPYPGTVNTVATQLICDQLAQQFDVPATWQANDVTLGSLSDTTLNTDVVFDSGAFGTVTAQVTAYVEAAYMAVNLLSLPAGGAAQADESWALWNIFDPGALPPPGMPNGDQTLAAADLTAAQNFITTSGGLANAQQALGYVNIWVPVGTDTAGQVPQEFMSVDEPPSPVLLGLYLLSGLAMFGAFRKYASAR
jgi:hypothetical protein